jgi:hypothetical protein
MLNKFFSFTLSRGIINILFVNNEYIIYYNKYNKYNSEYFLYPINTNKLYSLSKGSQQKTIHEIDENGGKWTSWIEFYNKSYSKKYYNILESYVR